jgi:ABC-type sugar transport system permease subunit
MKEILRNRKRQLLSVLAITLIIYLAFVAWTIFEYNRYASTTTAKYEARGIPRHLIDLLTYGHFWYAKAVFWTGVGLAITWVFIAFAGTKKKTGVAMCCMVLIIRFR